MIFAFLLLTTLAPSTSDTDHPGIDDVPANNEETAVNAFATLNVTAFDDSIPFYDNVTESGRRNLQVSMCAYTTERYGQTRNAAPWGLGDTSAWGPKVPCKTGGVGPGNDGTCKTTDNVGENWEGWCTRDGEADHVGGKPDWGYCRPCEEVEWEKTSTGKTCGVGNSLHGVSYTKSTSNDDDNRNRCKTACDGNEECAGFNYMNLNHPYAVWRGLCAFRTSIPDPDGTNADAYRECWVKGKETVTSFTPTFAPSASNPSQAPSYSPTISNPTCVPTTTLPSALPTTVPTSSRPTFTPSLNPTTNEPTAFPTTDEPTSLPTLNPTTEPPTNLPTSEMETTAPPLTDCDEAADDTGAEETFEEVLCLCNEFRDYGWSRERKVLTSRLVSQMEALRDAAGPISNDSPKFLKKWNRLMNFSLSHQKNRRIWRKVCRINKGKERFLRKAAEKIDNMS